MLSRWLEGKKTKNFITPVWKQGKKRAAGKQFPRSPADDLSDPGAGDAFLHHRLRVGKYQGTTGWNIDRFRAPHERPFIGAPGMGIDKLQTAMVLQIRGMNRLSVALDITW